MLLVDAAVLGPVDVVHGLDAGRGAEDADVLELLPGLHGALVVLHLFAGAGGVGDALELVQVAREAAGDDQVGGGHPALEQVVDLPAHQVHCGGEQGGELVPIGLGEEEGDDLLFALDHPGGRVHAALGETPDLGLAVVHAAEVAVDGADARVALGGQEDDPVEDGFGHDDQPGAAVDLVDQGLEVGRAAGAGALDEDAVGVGGKDGVALLLGGLDGADEHLAPEGGDGFVGLDVAVQVVLEALVAKGDVAEPFEGVGHGVQVGMARVGLAQLRHAALDRQPLLEQGFQDGRHQPGHVLGDGHMGLGDVEGILPLHPHGLAADVHLHHQAGVHGKVIEGGDVVVQPNDGAVVQPAVIGQVELGGGFEALGLDLVLGDEHAAAQGFGHLHGGEAGPGAVAGSHFERQGGDASQLNGGDHAEAADGAVGGVDVGAPEQEGLPGAVVDHAVTLEGDLVAGEVFAAEVAAGVEVELVIAGPAQQCREEPAVAPTRHEDVGVEGIQQCGEILEHLQGLVEAQGAFLVSTGDEQAGGAGELRVGIGQDGHGAQAGDGIVDLPGAVLRVDVEQVVIFVVGEEAAGGGEGTRGGGVAHREGDVDVEVAQFSRAETPFQVGGEALLEDRVGGLDGQHLLGTVVQVEPFGEGGAHPEDVLFEEEGDLFEGPGLAGDIERGE